MGTWIGQSRLPRKWAEVAAATRSFACVVVLVTLALAALCPAPGIAAESSPSPLPGEEKVMRIGWVESPSNLNPFIGMTTSDWVLWLLNYDYLVSYDAATLEPKPGLATSWSVSEDGKTWTFETRQGVTWQDGEPFTAGDVAFTFNYMLENGLTNMSVYTDGITGARALSDSTVEIYTSVPKANMLAMLVPILPEHVWSKVPGEAAESTYQNEPPIVGTGPFQVIDFKPERYLRLVANKDYWGGGPKIDELIIQIYTNPQTMTLDLQSGAIDGAVNVPTAQFGALKDVPGITLNEGTAWTFTALQLNCYDSPDSLGNPVLRDAKFRRALQYAVDRERVVDVAMQGYAAVGSTFMVPYSGYHWEPPANGAYRYDPAHCQALLEEAGYRDVDGDGYRETKDGRPLSLRIFATTDELWGQASARFVVGWFKDVGVKLKLSVLNAGALIDAQFNYSGNVPAPDFDIIASYWTNDLDPQPNLQSYTPAQIGVWNYVYWTNPEYTRLFEEQTQTIDPAQRKSIVERMEQIHYEDSPEVVLTYPYQLEAYRTDRWTGWVRTPSDTPLWSGSALYNWMNRDTYTNVEPKMATANDGSSRTGLIVAVAVAAAVVVAVFVVLRARRRGKAVEE
jgi:peptide/nickel transport system substrate-binding protein